jgi:hypothetical protein
MIADFASQGASANFGMGSNHFRQMLNQRRTKCPPTDTHGTIHGPKCAKWIRTCLLKSTSVQRSEQAAALQRIESKAGEPAPTAYPGRLKSPRLAWIIASVFFTAFIAALTLAAVAYFRKAPSDQQAIRFTVTAPEGYGDEELWRSLPMANVSS